LWDISPRIQQNLFCIFLIFLRFAMQFTRNSQSTFTIGVTNCREALGKKLFFAMWPLGRPDGAGGSIPVITGGGTGWGRAG
jgi:hypothetical protein